MKKLVIMPGGFHPFHAGHLALYQSAKKAFPDAEVYVAATNDQSERPFPFALKEKLAKLAGVEPGHFIQVKSPFQAKEITQNYDPDQDVLIFVRSEKDRGEQPQPGGTKKDGSPAYFQPWTGKNVQPFSKHAYMAYLPTVEFGPGITSASEIRKAWPTLNDKRKMAMVMSLYPATQTNTKLAKNVVKMFDEVMGSQESVAEARSNPDQNKKHVAGKVDLLIYAENNIEDTRNWGVSMTALPKLGINPRAGISEDTPKGIYFYPLEYFISMINHEKPLPWANNYPYIQLFQYDRSHMITKNTQVDPDRLKQALRQYCSEEIIQQVIEDGQYNDDPYWFIWDCLVRLDKSDETTIIRWNKVLRDLGFTCAFDPGYGWIAPGEKTQGVILDPRIITQHKMFFNRNPTVKRDRYDIKELANTITYTQGYMNEISRLRLPFRDASEEKARLDVAKSMLRQFLGKTEKEAKEMGFEQARKAAGEKVIEILKQNMAKESVYESLDYLEEK